jgi:hypothetical protein
MKQLIQSVFVSLALVFGTVSYAEKPAETKKVCMDKLTKDGKVVTGKDGKPVQDCKEVKIHKKLDGTKVPTK